MCGVCGAFLTLSTVEEKRVINEPKSYIATRIEKAPHPRTPRTSSRHYRALLPVGGVAAKGAAAWPRRIASDILVMASCTMPYRSTTASIVMSRAKTTPLTHAVNIAPPFEPLADRARVLAVGGDERRVVLLRYQRKESLRRPAQDVK
jgi:hypothetical protein